MTEKSNILASFRMRMRLKLLLGVLFIVLLHTDTVFGQSYQIHKDLDESWYYIDDNQRYQSFESHKKEQKISLTIDRSLPKGSILSISIGDNTSIYIDGTIIDFVVKGNAISYNLDSLFLAAAPDAEQLTLMLFHPEHVSLISSKIHYQLLSTTKSTQPLIERDDTNFGNIFSIFILVTLVLLTYIKLAHADIWKEYMKWPRILSSKDQGDAIYKLRPFEKGTLMIVLGYAMLSTTVMFGLFYLSGFSIVGSEYFQSDHTFSAISKWLGLGITLFALAFMKFFLVKSFTKLFSFRGASRMHFYNHVRISIVLTVVLLFIEVVLIFGFQRIVLENWFLKIMTVLMIAKSILVSLKLINISSYRMFHLFSYLCATEIVPAIILVKITFLLLV